MKACAGVYSGRLEEEEEEEVSAPFGLGEKGGEAGEGRTSWPVR